MALTDNIPALLEEVKRLDADSLEQLEELRIKYISKKGIIPQLITEFRSVEPERKRELGIAINELKTLAQNRINALREKLGVSSLKQLQQFAAILNSGGNSVPDDGAPGKGC